jgi:hypothetical protein
VVRSDERVYQVQLVGGWPFSRLVRVGGRDLTPPEIQREDRKEQEFRNRIAGRDLEKAARDQESWIPSELVARSQYTMVGREAGAGRQTVVLAFTPKSSNPASSIQDRILNRLSGRIWVDEEDAEIARVEIRLTEEFSLGWLGMLGSLSQCDLRMERQRMADGTWVQNRHTLLLVGRKLFSPMRFRVTETSSNFRRIPH